MDNANWQLVTSMAVVIPLTEKGFYHAPCTNADRYEKLKLKKWKKAILSNLIVFLLISCSSTGKSQKSAKGEAASETAKFKLLNMLAYDLSKLKYDGEIVIQKAWEDANGCKYYT